MKPGAIIYTGKAKTLYLTEDQNTLWMQFRNDTSAFNGQKVEKLKDKGRVNNYFNAFIMRYLQEKGLPVHFIDRVSEDSALVKKLQMLPIECVVRNRVAGSLAKRLGIPEGTLLKAPLFEFFLKNDALGDPLINDYHILAFDWASEEEIALMKAASLKVNQLLSPLFFESGLELVDFKLEFGRFDNQLWIGDEITPDGCRIWDRESHEKLDKDRFRRDLGQVVESYQLVAHRLKVPLP